MNETLSQRRNPSEAILNWAKGDKWLLFWLIFVAGWYLIPWWNKVYFLWDDIELLMRFRHPVLDAFFASHQYQFFPVFLFFYSLETNLFGVNPSAFLAVSVGLHLVNIWLVYVLINKLTKNNLLSFLASMLVSFNKSYFTVIFWPTIQTHILLTTFSLLSVLILLKIKNQYSFSKTLPLFLCLILAGLSLGFGIGVGTMLAIFAYFFLPKTMGKVAVMTAGFLSSLVSITGVIAFSSQELTQNNLLQLSVRKIWNILYFTAVGPTQAIINRFLIPGFIPNIYSPFNIAIMIILPALVIGLTLWIIYKTVISPQAKLIYPLLFFGSLIIMPYFIASLARSGPGALGALAERYVYFPFFFFILTLIYGLFLIEKVPFHGKKSVTLRKYIVVVFGLLSIGHQILLFVATNNLFWLPPPTHRVNSANLPTLSSTQSPPPAAAALFRRNDYRRSSISGGH